MISAFPLNCAIDYPIRARIPDRHLMKTLLIDRVKALGDTKIEHDIWSSHSGSEVSRSISDNRK